MASLTNDGRRAVLEHLQLNAGVSVDDTHLPHEFFPIAEHLRALESQVVLVVGDRGAGKSALMQALARPQLRDALAARAPSVRLPSGSVQWCRGWPLEREGPSAPIWSRFAQEHERHRGDVADAWFAYLVRTLKNELSADARLAVAGLLGAPAADVEQCFRSVRGDPVAPTSALDDLDAKLATEDRWLFVAYDELDTATLDDWNALGVIVRGLVSFWAANARRWKRIRPKLFLRSDFYQHHREIAGADVSKLAANRVELRWSDRDVYGALVKHLLNKHDAIATHLTGSRITVDEDPVLGRLPRLARAEDARPVVERLIGEYMGPDKKKGETFTWILDHLRDGNDRIVPRTLVWLVEYAAQRELQDMRAAGARLLSYISVRYALDDVSRQFVNEAMTHELRWLAGLRTRLAAQRLVPWQRRELEKLLSNDFEGPWSPTQDVRPPGNDARELLDNLLVLGVLRQRTSESYDVPDLYLAGLGLTRKGGVAKK